MVRNSLLLLILLVAVGAQAAPPEVTRVNSKDGAEMVLVPAGDYVASHLSLSKPETRRLESYYIYRYPVSIAQYRKFCAATGREMPKQPKWDDAASLVPKRWLQKDAAPVTGVTWDDAQAYCRWAGVSLPTDGQWEKAAWGTRTPDAGVESPYGVEEMRQVVFQWCEFDQEDRDTPDVRKFIADGVHSIRGAPGPFDPQPTLHSSATRGTNGNGFRCVLNVKALKL